MEQLTAKKTFINPVYKDKVVILKTAADTAGAYSLAELTVYPGGGNTYHTHSAFTETFTAKEGNLGVMLGKKKCILQPGQSVTVPRHTPHYFFNDGISPIVCHIQFTPAHDNFIKGLAIAYGLALDGKTNKVGVPQSLMHLALLMKLTDTRPTFFIAKLLLPLLWLLAKRAEKKGIVDKLLEKYYYINHL